MPLYTTPELERAREEWARIPKRAPRPAPKLQQTTPVYRVVQDLQPISVLFVDSYGEVRSVLAQAQAEIVRLWTLNQRGYNLFSCLDSAGIRISTSLTRKGSWKLHSSGRSANRIALDALLGHPEQKEGKDLEHRFRDKYTARGIEFSDFDNFDYIITFDNDILKDLRALEWAAYRRAVQRGRKGLRARTKLLGDYNLRYAGSVLISSPAFTGIVPRRSDFDQTVRLIENELFNFLHTITGWSRPERISITALAHRYRSRQFLAPSSRVTDSKIRTLRLLYNRVSVDEEVEGRDTRVVTVTTREDKLREAVDDCRMVLG